MEDEEMSFWDGPFSDSFCWQGFREGNDVLKNERMDIPLLVGEAHW